MLYLLAMERKVSVNRFGVTGDPIYPPALHRVTSSDQLALLAIVLVGQFMADCRDALFMIDNEEKARVRAELKGRRGWTEEKIRTKQDDPR